MIVPLEKWPEQTKAKINWATGTAAYYTMRGELLGIRKFKEN
jgi:hypothetical protein